MRTILFALLCALPICAFSENDLGYFLSVKASSIDVDDPDGDTDAETGFIPQLRITYDPSSSRGSRYVAGVDFLDMEFDGDTGSVNQEVSGYTLFFGYEKQLVLSSAFKPWLSATLNFNDHSFEKRFTADEDGFLDEIFDNRDESYIGVSFHADNYFSLGENVRFGLGPFVDLSFGDGVQTIGVRLTLGKE